MKSSIRLGRVFGIPISLHLTFILFVAFLGMVYAFQGGAKAAITGVSFILALFLSVTLHELGHSLVARRFGIKVRGIVLLPIGGVSQMEEMPRKPSQEFLVAVAGPATSIVLGLLLGGASLLLYGPEATFKTTLTGGLFLPNIARVNLLLAIFNLLPGFPMDGGRIFRSALARGMSFERATVIAAAVGRVFAIGLGLVGLFTNIWLVFIAVFIYFGASAEANQVKIRSALHDVPVTRVMATAFETLDPDDRLGTAVEHAYRGIQEDFPVVLDGKLVGVLMKQDILAALHEYGPGALVGRVMRREFTTVTTDQTLEQVYGAIQACRCTSLPVLEAGRVVGVVTLEALGRYLAYAGAGSGAGGT
ncbi:site-2 protease family protein [candidate division WOR-3 bacterium]|nr:site-2 protease family protein [candidate division WOR-3 bacterium]